MNPNYTAYNMRPYFSKQPGQPTHCPQCGGLLSMTSITPSTAVSADMEHDSLIPVHDYSLLFVCRTCGWWLIRESWDFCEINGEYDYLAVGNFPAHIQPGDISEWEDQPWRSALADPHIYEHAGDLPAAIARIFPRKAKKESW